MKVVFCVPISHFYGDVVSMDHRVKCLPESELSVCDAQGRCVAAPDDLVLNKRMFSGHKNVV